MATPASESDAIGAGTPLMEAGVDSLAATDLSNRLREATVWHDPPEYYDPRGGVLAMVLDVPAELISPPGGMSSRGHITLINHQLNFQHIERRWR